jgi:hypothetical protein
VVEVAVPYVSRVSYSRVRLGQLDSEPAVTAQEFVQPANVRAWSFCYRMLLKSWLVFLIASQLSQYISLGISCPHPTIFVNPVLVGSPN